MQKEHRSLIIDKDAKHKPAQRQSRRAAEKRRGGGERERYTQGKEGQKACALKGVLGGQVGMISLALDICPNGRAEAASEEVDKW